MYEQIFTGMQITSVCNENKKPFEIVQMALKY